MHWYFGSVNLGKFQDSNGGAAPCRYHDAAVENGLLHVTRKVGRLLASIIATDTSAVYVDRYMG